MRLSTGSHECCRTARRNLWIRAKLATLGIGDTDSFLWYHRLRPPDGRRVRRRAGNLLNDRAADNAGHFGWLALMWVVLIFAGARTEFVAAICFRQVSNDCCGCIWFIFIAGPTVAVAAGPALIIAALAATVDEETDIDWPPPQLAIAVTAITMCGVGICALLVLDVGWLWRTIGG